MTSRRPQCVTVAACAAALLRKGMKGVPLSLQSISKAVFCSSSRLPSNLRVTDLPSISASKAILDGRMGQHNQGGRQKDTPADGQCQELLPWEGAASCVPAAVHGSRFRLTATTTVVDCCRRMQGHETAKRSGMHASSRCAAGHVAGMQLVCSCQATHECLLAACESMTSQSRQAPWQCMLGGTSAAVEWSTAGSLLGLQAPYVYYDECVNQSTKMSADAAYHAGASGLLTGSHVCFWAAAFCRSCKRSFSTSR